jgi:hypothetical protein
LAGLERDLGLRVQPVEPRALFRAGNPDLDWFALAGPEHVSQLGRAFLEANLDRLHPTTRAFMEAGMRVTVDELWTRVAGGSSTSASSMSCSATTE